MAKGDIRLLALRSLAMLSLSEGWPLKAKREINETLLAPAFLFDNEDCCA
jgi:hypothetical protein